MSSGKPVLYSYFRSSCSWRVRIALNLKGVDFETKAVHLIKDGGEQHKEDYKALNPMAQVPTLVHQGLVLTQSLAIMEYLEEKYPGGAPLLPKGLLDRAHVRELSEVISSGIQPIQNLNVMQKFSSETEKRMKWSHHWITRGLQGVEKLMDKYSGKFCVGDEVSMADCCLIPQVYNANRFKVDMTQFPNIQRICKELETLEVFKKAHPTAQPDCPEDLK
uniref:Maleylacetoacetate isomerase n=1 Tax=Caligus rogercresseyi TaxID=217165 RepID=C1BQG6_CALRO|nr:Maleylacetoacetate isomerase [Caligus rogercresseyi]|eukprot:TRINITY_DN3424_c0_g1_i1.p1 TRINITY_DN3424_c0_g1~~TRINITY_DN3424_c0_g1_i1.p1  ORF type:complete len:219 (-),score=43.01 TRINITY_DN3424_c0_g1_i1:116-772(-)